MSMPDEPRRARRLQILMAGAAAVATGSAMLAPVGPVFATSGPPPAPPAPDAEQARVVTLVTGDRVRLGDGEHQPTLLPGSPSYGRQPLVFGSARSTYVVPRMSGEAFDRLDYSLFDVTALARQPDGTVPVSVRFARGTRPHDVPGIDVDVETAVRTPAGQVVTQGSYVAGESNADPAAWSGVASVRLADAPARSAAGDRAKRRTLTIKVRGRSGKPVKRATAWVQNLDNGRRFNKPVKVKNGRARVEVPKGNYSVMAYRTAYLVGRPEFAVKKDKTIRLDLSDATVPHKVSVEGAPSVGAKGWPDMSIARNSEKHGRFFIVGDPTARLQPMPGPFAHGSLGVAVAGYFARDGKGGADVFTLDVESGIPRDLTYRHDRSDFARVPLRAYADGAPRNGRRARNYIRDDLSGRTEGIPPSGGWARAVDLPATKLLWLQADKDVTWVRSFSIFEAGGWNSDNVGFKLRKSYEPGPAEPVQILRGPIGPGREHHLDGRKTGPHCTMCRVGATLRGRLPIVSGADSQSWRTVASPSMGSWTLRQGGNVLQRGTSSISPKVKLPAAEKKYVLRAVSRMGKLGWRLSTKVSTSWGFTSGKSTQVVPLLMPSYAPPTDLAGRADPGEVTYRLDLGNLGPVDARITKASVRYSTDDGESWDDATVERIDKNSFEVAYDNPAASSRCKYVSLQVRATDAGGRTVKETAIRAYRLTKG